MNTLNQFTNQLNQLSVILNVKEDKLRVNATNRVLTPGLVSELSDLKQEIIYLLKNTAFPAPHKISTLERGDYLPLSYAQERLWFIEQLEGHSAFYNISSRSRLKCHVRVDVLKQSVQQIVERYEVFRMRQVVSDQRLLSSKEALTGNEEKVEILLKAMRNVSTYFGHLIQN